MNATISHGGCNGDTQPPTVHVTCPGTGQEGWHIPSALRQWQPKVSLEDMTVDCADLHFTFSLDPFIRHCLLNGLDSIALTLEHGAEISAFEDSMPAWERAVH